ncbi:DUF3011 domain-containing protein [Lysobacter antibioticus]|uniref:DUF3011 domain-containing protein n=1 Tax=Lysobacter TaxID=68 RepID=UPI000A4658BC|nr:DUF3011 domain-containing protein [Lysobacter antibioticus]
MSARILSGLSLMVGLGMAAGAAQAVPQYDDYGYNNVIRCESNDNRERRCDADTRGGVQLSRQLSKSSCSQGRSWGYDRSGIWVREGCRAEFTLGRGGGWNDGGGGWNGGGGGSGEVVRCDSNDNRPRTCRIDGNRARLQRQISSSPCIEGRSWGSRPGEVWVSDGCRAEFVASRGGGGGWNGGGGGWNGGGGGWGGGGQEVSCESRNNRQNRCNMSIRRDARLIKQNSGSPCIEGQTWGWDRNGVWVAGGCRGVFRVN